MTLIIFCKNISSLPYKQFIKEYVNFLLQGYQF